MSVLNEVSSQFIILQNKHIQIHLEYISLRYMEETVLLSFTEFSLFSLIDWRFYSQDSSINESLNLNEDLKFSTLLSSPDSVHCSATIPREGLSPVSSTDQSGILSGKCAG